MLKKWMKEASADMFENRKVVRAREWFASRILMLIPVANVIILFWWASPANNCRSPAGAR
jgi:hypothetical protein